MNKKDQLIATAREILAASPFSETEISVSSGEKMLTRYGDNKITQNVESQATSVSLRAIVRTGAGAKTARVECDQLDAASIEKTYARLAKILEVLPETSHIAELHAPGDRYAAIERDWRGLPAPETAAAAILKATSKATQAGFTASGAFSAEHSVWVYANSKGLVLSDMVSDSEFSCSMDDIDAAAGLAGPASTASIIESGAGRGFSTHQDPSRLEIDSSIQTAFEKCAASSRKRGGVPIALEPGAYDVVLEPAAVAELLVFFGWVGLSSKAYLEERSFCSKKLGEKILSERISLFDDPFDAQSGAAYFDGQGVAKRKIKFVENGVLKELASDLKTAAKLGRSSTGHGGAEPNASDPVPWNIGLDFEPSGPRASIEDSTAALVSKVRKGILVTQFHYTNLVDVMVPSVTGMTRNGTFLIENGKLTKPVRNMRFTQSLVDFLSGIDAISRERKRVSAFFGGASLAPSVLARGFHFSSGTGF